MQKQFFTMTGAIALALGLGMNVQNSLNDYGIGSNKLSAYVLAQSWGSTGGDSSGPVYYGMKPEAKIVKCKVTNTSSGSEGSSFDISGGFSIGMGGWTVGGSASSGSSTGSSTSIETEETYEAEQIICEEGYSVEVCRPFDPCNPNY